jgi:hypothetical protein
MKQKHTLFFTALSLIILTASGVNDHWYEFFNDEGITWNDAPIA